MGRAPGQLDHMPPVFRVRMQQWDDPSLSEYIMSRLEGMGAQSWRVLSVDSAGYVSLGLDSAVS